MESIKKARIFSSKDKNGRDEMVLAHGQKGKGRQIYGIIFLPEQPSSGYMAFVKLKDVARMEGIRSLFIEDDDGGDDVQCYLDEDNIYMPV